MPITAGVARRVFLILEKKKCVRKLILTQEFKTLAWVSCYCCHVSCLSFSHSFQLHIFFLFIFSQQFFKLTKSINNIENCIKFHHNFLSYSIQLNCGVFFSLWISVHSLFCALRKCNNVVNWSKWHGLQVNKAIKDHILLERRKKRKTIQ